MTIEVSTLEELKKAIKSGETEIVSHNDDVVNKLKAVRTAKKWGPIAVAGIIASIPAVLATGGLAAPLLYAVAPSAAPATGITITGIVALIVAVGGIIAISLFSDWEYVDIGPRGIKMKRKK